MLIYLCQELVVVLVALLVVEAVGAAAADNCDIVQSYVEQPAVLRMGNQVDSASEELASLVVPNLAVHY